jgi:hypothetical protein
VRILISTCLILSTMAAAAAPTMAQSLIVIALCAPDGPSGPTLSRLQTSQAVWISCMDLTPENQEFCSGIGQVAAAAGTGLACAEAIGMLEHLGVEKTFIDAVTPTAPVARTALDLTKAATEAPNPYLIQPNQTDLQFVMERASGNVDLIGCKIFGRSGPEATYVQPSDAAESASTGLSCADALQASVDAGAALSAKVSTVIAGAARAGILLQQGRVALDSDANEMKPAEFVIVRIGQWTMESDR